MAQTVSRLAVYANGLMENQKNFKYADSRIWQINEVNYKYKNI